MKNVINPIGATKKNHFFIAMILLIGMFVLPSCGKWGLYPDDWLEEIEDDLKSTIACRAFYVANFDYTEAEKDAITEELVDLAFEIEENASAFEPCLMYKSALEQMAPVNKGAAQILYYYNTTKVNFSKFNEEPMDGDRYVWSATELISGIKIKFKINSEARWEIEYDDYYSLDRYVKSLYN